MWNVTNFYNDNCQNDSLLLHNLLFRMLKLHTVSYQILLWPWPQEGLEWGYIKQTNKQTTTNKQQTNNKQTNNKQTNKSTSPISLWKTTWSYLPSCWYKNKKGRLIFILALFQDLYIVARNEATTEFLLSWEAELVYLHAWVQVHSSHHCTN